MYKAMEGLEEQAVHKYHFMPAAIEYTNFGGLGCFIRYKRPQDKPLRVREMIPTRALIECPDRDILLVRDTYDYHCYKPAEGVWDRYVPFSMQNANAMEDAEMPFYMLNYTDYITNPHNKSPNLRANRERLTNEARIVADSGGFQFMMGRFDWIDVRQLIDWYNSNVDIGMVLDIPPIGIEDIDNYLIMAKAQKHNTDFMMDNKRDSLEFFNVFHGSGEFGQRYHDIVFDERIDRLAIGGGYFGSYMSSLCRVFKTIKENSNHYKHAHLLGVWNLMQLVPLMRFARHGVVDLITSDASSATLSANSKTYMFQQTIDSKWEARSIGLASKCYIPNHHVTLPCSCPVCESIKYQDVFAVLGGAMVTHMLAHHNMHIMNTYVSRMRPIVEREDYKTLHTLMEAQLGTRSGIREAITAVKLADELALAKTSSDIEKVQRKYSLYLGDNSAALNYIDDTNGSLFEEDESVELPVAGEKADGDEFDYPAIVLRKIAIAKKYLAGETGEHGKKTDNQPKKKTMTATKTKREQKKFGGSTKAASSKPASSKAGSNAANKTK